MIEPSSDRLLSTQSINCTEKTCKEVIKLNNDRTELKNEADLRIEHMRSLNLVHCKTMSQRIKNDNLDFRTSVNNFKSDCLNSLVFKTNDDNMNSETDSQNFDSSLIIHGEVESDIDPLSDISAVNNNKVNNSYKNETSLDSNSVHNSLINYSSPDNEPSEFKKNESKYDKTVESKLVIIDTDNIISSKACSPVSKQGKNMNAYGTECSETFFDSDIDENTFLIEAASFVVPYVFEKSGKESFSQLLAQLKEESGNINNEKVTALDIPNENKPLQEKCTSLVHNPQDNKVESNDLIEDAKGSENKGNLADPLKIENKKNNFFNSTLGKFFKHLGMNLVQEFVQKDLLRMQKKKAGKEGGQGSFSTQQAIKCLQKNLDETRETNEPFKQKLKKCRICNFYTESIIVMQHHLEVPHYIGSVYLCNHCDYNSKNSQEIVFHVMSKHKMSARFERPSMLHQCPNCPFEDISRSKVTRHKISCDKKFKPDRNLEPTSDWDPPAKLCKPLGKAVPLIIPSPSQLRGRGRPIGAYKEGPISNFNRSHAVSNHLKNSSDYLSLSANNSLLYRSPNQQSAMISNNMKQNRNPFYQWMNGQVMPVMGNNYIPPSASPQRFMFPPSYSNMNNNTAVSLIPSVQANKGISSAKPATINLPSSLSIQNVKSGSKPNAIRQPQQPSISITPVPRQIPGKVTSGKGSVRPSLTKNAFVICEVCDGYIKDLEQLRNHMQWIHKVKIHPKMIHNRPPLNCQKCQYRFFTDQGLERHLLGSHGLVTSSMQEAANKGQDSGRCPICGKVYQWKLLNHVSKDHQMSLKPAHLSYKCTVCTATFNMYRLFENHVYSAHSMVAKRVLDAPKKSDASSATIKINNEITIIPQPKKIDSNESESKNFYADNNPLEDYFDSSQSQQQCDKNVNALELSSDISGDKTSNDIPTKFHSGEVTIEPVKSSRSRLVSSESDGLTTSALHCQTDISNLETYDLSSNNLKRKTCNDDDDITSKKFKANLLTCNSVLEEAHDPLA